MYNCALNYNENISYGFVYDNNTFMFLINGKINNGEYFINKEYYFKNVTCYNNVFAWNNIFNDILRGTFGLNLSNTAKTHKIIGTYGLKLPNVVTGKKNICHITINNKKCSC